MKKIIVGVIFLILTSSAFAQIQLPLGSKSPFGKRIYFGGNMGLQLGNITFVDVSPLVGYMITRKFSAGIGATYRYLKYKNINYQTNIYGGRLFARHNISVLKLPLFLYGEYELLNHEYDKNIDPNILKMTRDWVPSVLAGGGLFQSIGMRGGFVMMALYNLAYDNVRSPYNSPWVFRVGFTM